MPRAMPDELALNTQSPHMTLSVIIATKNRSATLGGTLESVVRQSLAVDEILIVDQSSDASTSDVVANFTDVLRAQGILLPHVIYIYDPKLSGAGAARNVAIERARGDLLIFLDDDVVLEEDFFKQLTEAYRCNPELGGVQGIITNYVCPPLRGRLLETFFYLGPFRDERQPIYWSAQTLRHSQPITVRKFTSCLMSVKRSALGPDRFDPEHNGRSEDIDLSWRVSERVLLAIAPAARARHLRTPLARSHESWQTASLTEFHYLYHRHWKTSVMNRFCFAWLKCGFGLFAVASSIRKRSTAPWSAFRATLSNTCDFGQVDKDTRRHGTAYASDGAIRNYKALPNNDRHGSQSGRDDVELKGD